ncbi:hypothetical protein [Nocardia gipuzkoensis]|uniref:hypothetical protein n=1 Tax=Nocardia gipuzkoensis TaxID=2749991 RepID=UPI003EE08886
MPRLARLRNGRWHDLRGLLLHGRDIGIDLFCGIGDGGLRGIEERGTTETRIGDRSDRLNPSLEIRDLITQTSPAIDRSVARLADGLADNAVLAGMRFRRRHLHAQRIAVAQRHGAGMGTHFSGEGLTHDRRLARGLAVPIQRKQRSEYSVQVVRQSRRHSTDSPSLITDRLSQF